MEHNTNPHDHGILKKVLFFLKFLEIRLRFVLILVVTALLVGYWDNIQNYIERWQRRHASPASQAATAAQARHGEAEGEYEYFCPMHTFVIRNHPGKCPICGMDLVQRKKGAAAVLPEGTLARVQVSPERVMQAGVQVEPVAYRLLTRTVQSYGVIEPDETRLARIIARFPGRIDKLMVNAVGMNVQQGEALAQIYSPKYLAAAQEYVQALKAERQGESLGVDGRKLSDFARQRLLLAGFTEEQIDNLKTDPGSASAVTLYSPLAGTVLEKSALLGEAVAEGTALYTIADLSRVWVQALVLESDLAAIKEQMPVEVASVAYPGEIFFGTVDFIYPTLNPENRTVKVRVAVDNGAGRLKPGMYVTTVLRSPVGRLVEEGAASQDAATTAVASATASAPTTATAPGKLPTETQEDADRFLAGLSAGAPYYQCPMHAEVVSDKPGDCPKCGMHLEQKQKAAPAEHAGHEAAMATDAAPRPLTEPIQPSTEQWAEGYSCAMHPDELSDKPGVCAVCGCGMALEKVRIERVLSIPEMAVVDTGQRYVVYVESAPGVYDARAVKLGARTGEYYPVLEGLKLGDKIVSRGSFLIDAEARLNPASAGNPAPAGNPAAAGASNGGASGGHQHGG